VAPVSITCQSTIDDPKEHIVNLSRKTNASSDRFLPQVEALEDRQLLSVASIPHVGPRTTGTSFLEGSVLLPHGPSVLRTGGAAFQEGSVLHLVLSQQADNEATLTDDGRGDITVEWNGHTPPTFHGVHEVVIDSLGQHDVIRYNCVAGAGTHAHEEVEVRLASSSSKFIPNPGALWSKGMDFDIEPGADRDGVAFQSGPVLFLALSKPVANQAVLVDDGHGDITVEWNGHTPTTFHNVGQVVIESLGRQDAIAYVLTGNVTKAHEVEVQLADTHSTFTPELGSFRTDGLTFHVETPPAPPQVEQAVDAFAGQGGFGRGQQSDGLVSAAIGSATGGAGAGKIK
jgi:hypothetical protein